MLRQVNLPTQVKHVVNVVLRLLLLLLMQLLLLLQLIMTMLWMSLHQLLDYPIASQYVRQSIVIT